MDNWIDFYDSAHSIYVNARHRDIHYHRIAEDIAAYVRPNATVVDYGCGEALHADIIAAKALRLILVEPAPSVRARLAQRFGANAKIAIRDGLAAMADGSADLVVMHSVAQYLAPGELDALLARFARLLAPDGLLIVGDVIPPGRSAFADAGELLRFAARNGFFFAALAGLARTTLSPYRKLRARLGLARYDEAALTKKLAAAGFSATRAPANIGHNRGRMTFLARPAGSPVRG